MLGRDPSAPRPLQRGARADEPRGSAACGNTRRMPELTAEARGQGATLALFPELALTGCAPEDLLLKNLSTSWTPRAPRSRS